MKKTRKRKTHCNNGHPRTVRNSYFDKEGFAVCRLCIRDKEGSPAYVGRRTRRIQARQVWINEYLKTHPCVDCGETDPVVLVFDHCRGKKKREVTSMGLFSTASVLKEINKCDVVCANDHARRTAKRANTIRWRLNK